MNHENLSTNVLFDGDVVRSRKKVKIRVSVDRNHCHLYGICEQEAPGVFHLTGDGRLEYTGKPGEHHLEATRQAARVCPMQAIRVEERR